MGLLCIVEPVPVLLVLLGLLVLFMLPVLLVLPVLLLVVALW